MPRIRRIAGLTASVAVLIGSSLVSGSGSASGVPVCPNAATPTSGSPGLISSPEELQGLHDDTTLWDEPWEMAGDIDMGGCIWTDHGIGTSAAPFSGVFDGSGHTITGLDIDVNGSYVGLFGYIKPVSSAAIVKNVTFTGDVHGVGYVGALVGYIHTSAQVVNSHTSGDVTADSTTAGGLVGYIRGYSTSVIDGSSATGAVLVDSGQSAGGLIGEAHYAMITDSFATGTATATGDSYAGGFIGYADGVTVERSYSAGDVAADREAAGFIGYLSAGIISDCYSLGSVTYTRTSGLGSVGGFLGYAWNSTVTDCYSIGAVTGNPAVTSNGGFLGNLDTGNTFTGSFWDTETSGWSTSAAGTPLTTAEMTDVASFSTWSITQSFDAGSTWGICPAVNSGYPFLTVFHSSNPCSGAQGRRTTPAPPMMQALPLPASGECADVDDAAYGYGTGVTGGWARSWQPWVRTDGEEIARGGWACVRVLEYSLGSESWHAQGSA